MSNIFVSMQVDTIAVGAIAIIATGAILVFRIEDETKMRPSERS